MSGWERHGDGYARECKGFKLTVNPCKSPYWLDHWDWSVAPSSDSNGEEAEGTAKALNRAMEIAERLTDVLRLEANGTRT